MRVVAYINANSGPDYHRVIMPLMLMQDVDVFITNNLLEEHFAKGCEVFMYNRILPDHCIEKLMELKKKYGFTICVDVDDWWHLDPHHVLYQDYIDTGFAGKQEWHIKNADFITVTHDRLAGEVLKLNKRVHILPNAIPCQGQYDIERTPSKFTRFFWQGSSTHREDVELLARPLQSIADIAGKIKMVIGGFVEYDPIWHEMASMYTAGFKHQYKIIPGKNVAEYYSMYQEADVCLVPLINSPFNRMKSNLKVLEAANLGLPVIASAVHPYIGLPVLYAKNSTDWVTHIRRMAASKKRQKEAGQELKEYVDKHFNFHKINSERKQIFEHQISLV